MAMRWPWRKHDAELDREIAHHLDSLADEFARQGMPRDEALRRARAEFGGVDKHTEECRDQRRFRLLAELRQDAAFGWRTMRKTPAVTAAAILSLALGIGATTALLSMTDAILWRHIGVPEPEMLTEVFWTSMKPSNVVHASAGGTYPDGPLRVSDFFSSASYETMRARVAGRAELAAHLYPARETVRYRDATALAHVRPVSGNFFAALRPALQHGRYFTDADDNPGAQPVVIVTHRFWTAHMGADPNAVGRTMRISSRSYAVTGVLGAAFEGISTGEATDLYIPIRQSPMWTGPNDWFRVHAADPSYWLFQLIARRRPGVPEEALRAELDAAFASSWPVRPASPEAAPRIRLQDASRGLGSPRRQLGNPLYMLLGLAGLVLLIACANVANLLLARSAARVKEVALRISLGCHRGRLVRQFLTESAMVSAAGGVLSLGVALALLDAMVKLAPAGPDGLALSFGLDPRILLAAFVVTALTTVTFGLYPAWKAAGVSALPALKEGSGIAAAAGRSRWNAGKALVLAQVTLGVLLVTAATAFTGNLWEILHRDTGFDRANLLLFDVRPSESGYEGQRLRQFYLELERRAAAVPGVEAVGLAQVRPIGNRGGTHDMLRKPGESKKIQTAANWVNAPYLATLGVPIVEGRGFTEQEVRTGANVAVVSEDLAKELGGRAPGQRVRWMDQKEFEVIGVAASARYTNLFQKPNVIYMPAEYGEGMTVVARTKAAPARALRPMREALREIDRDLPMIDVFTMEEQIARTLRRERMFAWLCGSFGVLALVLCVVGLYGVISYSTVRRAAEIGLRMALGATRANVLVRVFGGGMSLAAIGLVLGAPAAVYGIRLAQQQRMLPAGPLPVNAIALALATIAIASAISIAVPALRAASVDPAKTLRQG